MRTTSKVIIIDGQQHLMSTTSFTVTNQINNMATKTTKELETLLRKVRAELGRERAAHKGTSEKYEIALDLIKQEREAHIRTKADLSTLNTQYQELLRMGEDKIAPEPDCYFSAPKKVISHFAVVEKMEDQDFVMKTDSGSTIDGKHVGKKADTDAIVDYLKSDVEGLLNNTFAGSKFRITVEAEQI